jgi:hypothetical protein
LDSDRFDHLARSLGRAVSRRGTLGILVGAVAVFGEAVPGRAKPRIEKVPVKIPGKIPICHDGKTLLLSRRKALRYLKHGGTLGRCDRLGKDTCVPLGQICNRNLGNECCNSDSAVCASPIKNDRTFTFCLDHSPDIPDKYYECTSNAQCAERYSDRPQDVVCAEPGLANCLPNAAHCCVQKPCERDSDCPISGICCKALTGWKCCAPSQDCVRAVGCVTV